PVSDAVFVHAAAPAGISAVSLHDALPILAFGIASQLHVQNAYWAAMPVWVVAQAQRGLLLERAIFRVVGTLVGAFIGFAILTLRSEEHTSELQSRENLVCRLRLGKNTSAG